MSAYLVQFLVALATVALKGFQYKNVQGNHYRLVGITSFLMAAGDVVSVGLIVHNGWWSIIPAGVGASLGMVGSMWVHDRYIPKENTKQPSKLRNAKSH
jgi:CHASE2 domain-containing sensor protein